MRRSNSILAVALVTGFAVMALGGRDPFKGTWKIQADADAGGSEKGFAEVLTFKAQQMTAEGLMKKGWKQVSFEDDTRGVSVAAFTCVLKHESQGEMKWVGNVTANEIRGTIVWKKTGGEEVRYTYNGTKS